MASPFDGCRHIASGLLGVDETLEQELDAVQAAYFSHVSNKENYSSDTESASSDDDENDNLFENSIAPRLINESTIAENSSEDSTVVTDDQLPVTSYTTTTSSRPSGKGSFIMPL
ncbi:hypothetical protein OS493_015350 [Desmophyllum pertusum]|uniref:Uncharacterized protein n=1 Tax=Desmophyllum pertusum TaxID=174260 RepID=A0A9W9ZGG5_9CNID|nr:hypothetical protein OS493_015350 [Desmophyllum pertusum]